MVEAWSTSSMNYPAASRGVSDNARIPSEESELLRMELGVHLLPPLDCDVPAVLRGADHAVEQRGEIVAAVDVLTPTASLAHGRGKLRGMNPQ